MQSVGDVSVRALPERNAARLGVLILCFLVALVDGYDTIAPSIVATQYASELGLKPIELGWMFGASTLGFFIGAISGGRLSDRFGRKGVLILCVVAFGLFSLGAGAASDATSFIIMRFLSGVGLGGAQPNFIAIAAEAGPAQSRATRVTAITAGLPLGGVLAAAVLLAFPKAMDWRTLFYLGGWAPLLLAVALYLLLPRDGTSLKMSEDRGAPAPAGSARVFGDGRWPVTLWLWTAFFCTTLVLYIMLNWLPTLLVAKGYSLQEATQVALLFNLGGVGGGLIGLVLDRYPQRWVRAMPYMAMAGAVLALAAIPYSLPAALIAGAATGFCTIGAQFMLYALTPQYYPAACRGAGVGMAIASGRVGAIVGPVMTGVLLAGGNSSSLVLAAIVPLIGLALIALIFITRSRMLQIFD